MSYYKDFPINDKPKSVVRSLVFAVIQIKNCDVWFMSVKVTDKVNNYNVLFFDENFFYRFEVRNITSEDIRMLHKFPNVYYWRESLPF